MEVLQAKDLKKIYGSGNKDVYKRQPLHQWKIQSLRSFYGQW